MAVVHDHQPKAHQQEGEREAEVVAVVHAAQHHADQHHAERDAERGGQDVDAPAVEADRVGVGALAAADPRLRARLNGRAQAGERARHRVSGHGDGF